MLQRFSASVLQRLRVPATRSNDMAAWRQLASNVPEGAGRSTPDVVQNSGAFDESQLDTLVCPLSKGKLKWDPVNSELISEEINVAYPVVNGTPNLKPESARELSTPVPGANADEVPAQPS